MGPPEPPGSDSGPSAQLWRWGMVFLLAATFAVYLPGVVGGGFTDWDDTAYILTNPAMQSVQGLGHIWTSPGGEQYYPLTFTTYWLEYRLWGQDATGYLATNLALHLLCTWLVARLARALGLGPGPALLAAALFAIHPAQAATIFWIAERKNVLAAAFMLPAILCWVRSARSERPAGALIASTLLFGAALLSKTQVIGLPIGLVLLNALVLRRSVGKSVLRAAPMLALCVVAAAVTITFERKFIDTTAAAWTPSPPERLQLAGATTWWYLGKLFVPSLPSIVYPEFRVRAASAVWWMPLIAGLITAMVMLTQSVRGRLDGRITWGLTHTALMLGPVSGLVIYGNMSITHVSDYFVYLGAPGFWIAIVVGGSLAAARWKATARVLPATALLFVAVAGVQVIRSGPIFENGRTFWSRALEVAPESYGAHLGVGQALFRQGASAQGEQHLRHAIELRPTWADAYAILGTRQLAAGDVEGAAGTFALALERTTGSSEIHMGIAQIHERQGRPREALDTYAQVVGTDPHNTEALLALGRLSLGFARYADAESQFRTLVRLRPDLPMAAVGHATALRRLGRAAEAVAVLETALQQAPGDAALTNMLALLHATSADPSVRSPARALELAQRAAVLTGNAPDALDTLAAAQAALGRFGEAVATSESAAAAHAQAGNSRGVQESQRRSALYRSGQALAE